MLIAMTFNGYILLAIMLGGTLGHFFSTRDTLGYGGVVVRQERSADQDSIEEKAGGGNGDEQHARDGLRVRSRPDVYNTASGACC